MGQEIPGVGEKGTLGGCSKDSALEARGVGTGRYQTSTDVTESGLILPSFGTKERVCRHLHVTAFPSC